jgi:hypothetical protein
MRKNIEKVINTQPYQRVLLLKPRQQEEESPHSSCWRAELRRQWSNPLYQP